jgi:hypothetical protein
MLKAWVKRVTGNTTHHSAERQVPPPAFVKIEHNKDGFFLLYFDAAGDGLTDTWHQSLEDAKRQAKFEFEIEASEWFDDGT